jgi:hypothetical protein
MFTKLQYPREAFAEVMREMPADEVAPILEALEAVFFASMLPEERATVRIGVVLELHGKLEDIRAYHEWRDRDERAWFVVRMAPQALSPQTLNQLAYGLAYGRDLVVVSSSDQGLVITGIARRSAFTDGGLVLRIAAPRPGALVLEGGKRQLGVRYEGGQVFPTDVDVFSSDGPALAALTACGMKGYLRTLSEILRHARASASGALFLCVPEITGVPNQAKTPYTFQLPFLLKQLKEAERLVDQRRSEIKSSEEEKATSSRSAQLDFEEGTIRAHSTAFVEMIGTIAAVDGAVVLGPECQVLNAGFIVGDMSSERPQFIDWCHDIRGERIERRPQAGGARHATGFGVAWGVAGSVVFIVSADGPVTCALRLDDRLLAWSVHLLET